MKHLFSIIISLSALLTSCAEKKESVLSITPVSIDTLVEIPNNTIDLAELTYDTKTSNWILNGELFSGYAVDFYQDNIMKEKIGIWNGRKQNQTIKWYADGHYRQVANYHKGKLHGEKKTWSSSTDHVLISFLNYQFGKAHGEQKKWYPTGELFKKLNLNMGKEEGIQQAYRKNGDLFANYEAKEGRIFGLKKAALCFGLDDEIVQYEK